MSKYLLDTNIISYLDDDKSPYLQILEKKFNSLQDDDIVYISILSVFEYQSSIALNTDENIKNSLIKRKEEILNLFDVLNLKLSNENIFGELQLEYKKDTGINNKALKKHNFDLMIASQAIAENAILVSNDNIFENISKLRSDFYFENWIK